MRGVRVLLPVFFVGVLALAAAAHADCQPAPDCSGAPVGSVCQGGCSPAGCGYVAIDPATGEVCVCSDAECVVG